MTGKDVLEWHQLFHWIVWRQIRLESSVINVYFWKLHLWWVWPWCQDERRSKGPSLCSDHDYRPVVKSWLFIVTLINPQRRRTKISNKGCHMFSAILFTVYFVWKIRYANVLIIQCVSNDFESIFLIYFYFRNLAHNKISTIDPEAWQGCVNIDTM